MLSARFANHKPRNVGSRYLFEIAGAFAFGALCFFLKRGGKNSSVGGIFAVDRFFLVGKVFLPYLIFFGDERLAYLVVHSAFIGKFRIFTLNSVGIFLIFGRLRKMLFARLVIKNLRICGDSYRLLSYGRAKPHKRFFPGFVFFSLPSIISHGFFPFL